MLIDIHIYSMSNIDEELDMIHNEYENRKNSGKTFNKTTKYSHQFVHESHSIKIERIDNPVSENKYYCTEFERELEIYNDILKEIKEFTQLRNVTNEEVIEVLEKYKTIKQKQFIRKRNETEISYFLPITHIVWINKANKISQQDIPEEILSDSDNKNNDKKAKFNTVEYKVTYADKDYAYDSNFNGRYSPEWRWSKDPRPRGSGKKDIKKELKDI